MESKGLIIGFQMLEEFRKIDPDMPMQMATVFLLVAMMPGITMPDLADKAGISQSSCSRNVAALSKWHRNRREGHDLVEATEDPAYRRRKVVSLTPKGQRLAETLRSLMTIVG